MRLKTFAFAAALLAATPLHADSDGFGSGKMWGTSPSGVTVNGALSSSIMHTQNGVSAGQVNAAREGLLLATGSAGSLTIQAIGSQSIVSSTINGNDIDSNISADQDSSNTGDVTNEGQISSN